MSLTTFLEEADVRAKFREFFPRPKFVVEMPLLVPSQNKNYSLIGTAFDYLLRFHLEYWLGHRSQKRWVAFGALSRIAEDHDYKLAKYAKSALELAVKIHEKFLVSGDCGSDLLYACLKLAQFDAVVRAAHVSSKHIMDVNTKTEAQELRQLLEIVPTELFRTASLCFLNPTFGEGSVLVGGADADLILDDVLIDIKTTKKLELSQDYYNQILGYYILHKIGGITNYSGAVEINYIAIYFSRYGHLYKVDVGSLIDEARFQLFMDWFVARAREQFGESRSD
jgi:hypothetical protein